MGWRNGDVYKSGVGMIFTRVREDLLEFFVEKRSVLGQCEEKDSQ